MARKIRNTHTAPTQPGTFHGCPASDNGAVSTEARKLHLTICTLIPNDWRDEFIADLQDQDNAGDWLASLRNWQGRIERELDRLQAELNEAREALRNFGIGDPEAIKGTPNGGPNVAGLQVLLWYGKYLDAKEEIALWLGDL